MSPLHLRKTLLTLCAALFTCIAMPAHADTDYSDIWFEDGHSGWGVNFAQNDNAIFATFFVFDASNKPLWFGGTLLRSTDGVYTGALYTVTGDYYGYTPFDPGLNTATIAGAISFNAIDVSHGLLSYSVNGVSVNKTIQRQTLVPIQVGGNYLGAYFVSQNDSCAGGAASAYDTAQVIVTQTASPANLKIEFRDTLSPFNTICTLNGPSTQTGKVLDMSSATYNCGSNTLDPMHVADIRKLANGGVEFRYQTVAGPSCVTTGRVTAIGQ